jgi:hypothetical protein
MLVRQSELRRKHKRKAEAYKIRLRAELAAAPKYVAKPATEAKPKAAPRKKKVEEPTAEVVATPTEE